MAKRYLDYDGLSYLWSKIKAYISSSCGDGLTIDDIYPVGSIYMSVNAVDPNNLFSGTTWVQIKDRFLLAAGDTYTNAATGGAASVTLTAEQSGVPAHGHGMSHQHPASSNTYFVTNDNANAANGGFATASGGRWTDGQTASGTFHHYQNTGASSKSSTDNNTASAAAEAHENMPPYLAVNIWKRTA